MSRYINQHYLRPRRSRIWGASRLSKRDQLTSMFAGIDKDIEKIFFNLDQKSLHLLFKEYGRRYGKGAEEYARETFPKWKSGVTSLSVQTAERLLNFIPPYLSHDKRYEMIKKLRNHHREKWSFRSIVTTHDRWKLDVIPLVDELVKRSSEFRLPESLKRKATWLSNGDADVANRILASLELEETKVRSSNLEDEFKRIQFFVDQVPHTQIIRHSIGLPQGTINVVITPKKQTFIEKIFGGNKMTNQGEEERVANEEIQTALERLHKGGNLLDLEWNALTDEEKERLRKKVIEARFDLEVSRAKADQRFENAARDIAKTLQGLKALDESKGNYEVKSDFETASGKTSIRVKKDTNTAIIVVAIVIGIIILAMMR